MRLIPFMLLTTILAASPAVAQSISDNLPPAVSSTAPVAAPDATKEAVADPYTVADVAVDVTADTAAHARDQALVQAERAAFTQLCGRLNLPDSAAKLNDDAVAALVQSFDTQSEKQSAVRYIGVFTIRFKAVAVTKKVGHAVNAASTGGASTGEVTSLTSNNAAVDEAALAVAGHLVVGVQTPSLPVFVQIKKRLMALSQVVALDTLDLGRGVSHIDVRYAGSIDDLKAAFATQGFTLRIGGEGGSELIDTRTP